VAERGGRFERGVDLFGMHRRSFRGKASLGDRGG
jgi:hypothetical protein